MKLDNPLVRAGLSALALVFVVLLFIGGPVAADMTGRSHLEKALREEIAARQRVESELSALKGEVAKQSVESNKQHNETLILILKLTAKADANTKSLDWFHSWVTQARKK